jgi:hypothetical protein
MTDRDGYRRLLRDLLLELDSARPDDAPRLSDARLLDALHARAPLDADERRALAGSAATRERLAFLAAAARAAALLAWQEQLERPPAPLRLMAAAALEPAIAPLRIEGNQFAIDLTPTDRDGREWRISVELSAELQALTPAGFRLVDSEGEEWLRGHPDEHGELVGYWRRDESLWQRVHRVALSLEPA